MAKKDEKEDICAMCGRYKKLERHHLIFGSYSRTPADDEHIYIDICEDCHTKALRVIDRIHDNVAAERLSKMLGQMMYERDYIARNTMQDNILQKARASFMAKFGRNYL